jgi:hypothetical protein
MDVKSFITLGPDGKNLIKVKYLRTNPSRAETIKVFTTVKG